MSRLIVANHLTLDGVMQGPAREDEDRRDGFAHGGWARPNQDPAVDEAMGKALGNPGSFLFGRRTYEDLFGYWPKQTDGNPYTEALNAVPKYVVSRTLAEPLPWPNPTLLRGDADGDVAAAVAGLKARETRDVVTFGSGELVRTMLRHGLVDTLVLMIHPLVLGTGRRMFTDAGSSARLRLVDSVTTPSGVLVATYES